MAYKCANNCGTDVPNSGDTCKACADAIAQAIIKAREEAAQQQQVSKDVQAYQRRGAGGKRDGNLDAERAEKELKDK